MLSRVILKVLIQTIPALQIMATDIESDVMQDIDRYREDTEYLNL